MISRIGFVRLAMHSFAFLFLAAHARADYLVNGYPGTNRISDGGVIVGSYLPPPELSGLYETAGEDFAVTPDLKTVYQFTNTLGFSNLIFGYDVATGAYLSDKLLHLGSNPGISEDFIANATMSLIRPSDPFGAGDLFSVSGFYGYPAGSTPQIKRYNRATDAYVETIDPPTPQTIFDFAFGPDDRLYLAAESGVFVYQESAVGFDLVSPTPLLASATGKLTFGPDGLMYLLNPSADSIERYTIGGTLIDSFASISLDGFDGVLFGSRNFSIQFGVDGNLHVLAGPNTINKYDGTSGSLIATTIFQGVDPNFPDFPYALQGRVVYLAVPEPSSFLLAAVGLLLAPSRSRRGRRY